MPVFRMGIGCDAVERVFFSAARRNNMQFRTGEFFEPLMDTIQYIYGISHDAADGIARGELGISGSAFPIDYSEEAAARQRTHPQGDRFCAQFYKFMLTANGVLVSLNVVATPGAVQ